MAAALDVRQKERAVTEFRYCQKCQNEIMANSHKRLKRVCGDGADDSSRP